MTKPKHILAIRLSAMGDVAMTVPVINALVQQNPKVKITFLSRPFLKPLFDGIPNVNFLGIDVDQEFKGLLGLWRLSKVIKGLNVDAIADLHNVLRTQVVRKFFYSPKYNIKVLDKGRKEKKALTSIHNKKFVQLKSTHERYADVFRRMGFELVLDQSSLISLKRPTDNLNFEKGRFYIGIAPFAQYESKIYPLDLMEILVKRLSEENTFDILLFGGGKKETEILSSLASKYKHVISCAGKFKFPEELAIISNLDLMLSMDSANAHLAAMYGVKTITLWGATHPFAGFYPFLQPKEYCLTPDMEKYPNLPCSIYGNKICPGYEDAMRSIEPDTVVHLIKKTLHN